jgi:hypothetical protein
LPAQERKLHLPKILRGFKEILVCSFLLLFKKLSLLVFAGESSAWDKKALSPLLFLRYSTILPSGMSRISDENFALEFFSADPILVKSCRN